MIPEPFSCASVRVATAVGDLWLPADDETLLPFIRDSGVWEPSEHRLLASLMHPNCRFLDVGAHVGYFSALAALRAPEGTIDAIEPDPRNVQFCRLNLWSLAPHATVWPAALGSIRRAVGLKSTPQNSGDTRILATGDTAPSLAIEMPGDELFRGRQFDLIKIDVQGFEQEVVQGLQRTLQRSAPITLVVEFFPSAITARGVEPLKVLIGYRRLGLDLLVSLEDNLQRMDDIEITRICAASGKEGFVNLVLRG